MFTLISDLIKENENLPNRKLMKFAVNLSLFLFALVIFGDKSYSLTDYKIKNICKREKKESVCIKNLLQKKSDMKKGKPIEIPVIPHKI